MTLRDADGAPTSDAAALRAFLGLLERRLAATAGAPNSLRQQSRLTCRREGRRASRLVDGGHARTGRVETASVTRDRPNHGVSEGSRSETRAWQSCSQIHEDRLNIVDLVRDLRCERDLGQRRPQASGLSCFEIPTRDESFAVAFRRTERRRSRHLDPSRSLVTAAALRPLSGFR